MREISASRRNRSSRASDSGAGAAAEPKVLRFAFQGELKSVDPYQINESFSLSVNGAVYEGLVRRGPDMKLVPCLAMSWEVLNPLHRRFHLRKGVNFHEGQDFTADDVIFSAHRVLAPAPTSRAASRRTLRS